MSNAPMLQIENLSKTFFPDTPNERKALDRVNLCVNKGDFITILGSNGAGKSTLFNALAGTFLCDSGKIILDNKDITTMPEYKRASYIGRLFQDPMKGSAPSMTIEENLSMAYARGSKHGFFKRNFSIGINKDVKKLFKESLSRLELGLEDRMDAKMGLLSGGQRQAVTLLMCTLVTPKLLLLDEHTAALDPVTAQKVLSITEDIIGENNITTLMITHNIQSALKLGNRTIMMDSGHIIHDIDDITKKQLDVKSVMELFSKKDGSSLDNDRMLLS